MSEYMSPGWLRRGQQRHKWFKSKGRARCPDSNVQEDFEPDDSTYRNMVGEFYYHLMKEFAADADSA